MANVGGFGPLNDKPLDLALDLYGHPGVVALIDDVLNPPGGPCHAKDSAFTTKEK